MNNKADQNHESKNQNMIFKDSYENVHYKNNNETYKINFQQKLESQKEIKQSPGLNENRNMSPNS